jgi:hypothetical protein
MIPSDFKDPLRFRSPSAERRKGRRRWIVSLGALVLGLLFVGLGLLLTLKPSSLELLSKGLSLLGAEPGDERVIENDALSIIGRDRPPSIDLVVSKRKYVNFTKIKGNLVMSDRMGFLVTYEAGLTGAVMRRALIQARR